MDALATVRRRLATQRLASEPFETPAEVVRWLGAMQAQEFEEAKWSISERTGGLTEAELDAAFDRGEILRTHVLRPTWHFVAPDDIRWLLALSGPRVNATNRSRYRRLELDDDVLRRSLEVIHAALAGGEALLRSELKTALEAAGIGTDGQRLPHIVMHAELEGLVCSGPRRGKQHTYMLLEERVPRAVSEPDDALAELTLRYFTSHGPATVHDFSWWSGLTVTQSRAGLSAIGDRLAAEQDEDERAWYSAPGAAAGAGAAAAYLIPTYDESTIAYRDLRVVRDPAPPRPGLLERPVVIDGRTVGSWKRVRGRRSAVLECTLFGPLRSGQERALKTSAERFGAFLGVPVELRAELATGAEGS